MIVSLEAGRAVRVWPKIRGKEIPPCTGARLGGGGRQC